MNQKEYKIGVKIWITEEGAPFIGYGRVILLEQIKKTGSITNAAKAIKMSYRQAWQIVAEMNERSQSPLVIKQLGGKNGGGATITDTGEQVITMFYELEARIKAFAIEESKKIDF